jgi:hypothetical protein
VNRIQKTFTLLAVLAIPAGAQISAPSTEKLCFASGTATFQLAPSAAAPDYRVRIERDLASADLRMRLVDRPEMADFVLVDDLSGGEEDACKPSTRVQTVKLDPAAEKPDVQSFDRGRADRAAPLCPFGAVLASGRRGSAGGDLEGRAKAQSARTRRPLKLDQSR